MRICCWGKRAGSTNHSCSCARNNACSAAWYIPVIVSHSVTKAVSLLILEIPKKSAFINPHAHCLSHHASCLSGGVVSRTQFSWNIDKPPVRIQWHHGRARYSGERIDVRFNLNFVWMLRSHKSPFTCSPDFSAWDVGTAQSFPGMRHCLYAVLFPLISSYGMHSFHGFFFGYMGMGWMASGYLMEARLYRTREQQSVFLLDIITIAKRSMKVVTWPSMLEPEPRSDLHIFKTRMMPPECGEWQGRVGVGKESLSRTPIRIIFFGRCQTQSLRRVSLVGWIMLRTTDDKRSSAMPPPTKAI